MVGPAREVLASCLGEDPFADEILVRFDRWGPDLFKGLALAYPAAHSLSGRITRLIADAVRNRPTDLRHRDRERLVRPDWYQQPDAIGYVAYADRFAGNLEGIRERIEYLRSFGVTYLHLMPLLQPRPEPNDGGYAVQDYRAVRPDLGTMDGLRTLARDLHSAGISLTLDLVLNHVAREHAWAKAARDGDARFRDYFHVFPDRATPDAYERSLPEVFPAFAPGNFTFDPDLQAWVWTTFNSWQWDLNWANPDVFCEFAELVLFLGNQGVDCLRLDAIAFIWKRLGTSCQNEPEVHAITQALRAIARIAMPSLIFKAEAIVGPDQVTAYLGNGRHAGKVSELAYHNSLMVQIWSALATADARLLVRALDRFPSIPTTSAWATYVRCHDDIGWAIDDADAGACGWNGAAHRAFLADYYAGDFEGSVSKGRHFQSNPATGDRRTSGSAASLCGVELALEQGDAEGLELAEARLLCAYALVFGFGGLPLIYMGDELGLINDYSYLDEPELRDDNRWMHRPPMPWNVADALAATSLAGRVAAGIRRLAQARAGCPAFHAASGTTLQVGPDPAVALLVRRHASGDVVQVANFSARQMTIGREDVPLGGDPLIDLITGQVVAGSAIALPPYGVLWLTVHPGGAGQELR